MPFFLITIDSGRVLFYQLTENELLKQHKNHCGQYQVQHRNIRAISH